MIKPSSNKYCSLNTLTNESDVEQFFLIRLLSDLGYSDTSIKTKTSLVELVVGRGSKSEKYKPDYVAFIDKKPKIVIDAKSPSERIDDYLYQVSGYALGLNRKYREENPVRYTILTNGSEFKLYHWDEEDPILTLSFEDFNDDNDKFKRLTQIVAFENLRNQTGLNELSVDEFLRRPSVNEIIAAFNKCHKIIWKKEKISPTDAFYEFTKVVFVKLNEDKRIRRILDENKMPLRTDFKFSIDWLNERESEIDNPLSAILFSDLLKSLQQEVEQNQKKPIFLTDEGINLKVSTIREVVKVLQEYDLYTIDEDLNGRMFETFLNATIRGRELGQYFTPRKVVKFMTKLANLQVNRINGEIVVDSVLDACCGTGGFLIDAMADLLDRYKKNQVLAPYKREVEKVIKSQSIYGIDANQKLSRIARINMYAHGDGGSRIYCTDSLDKKIVISQGVSSAIRKEQEELREILVDKATKFNVILTNPPFSMSYSSKESDERDILQQYASTDHKENLAFKTGTTELRSNVKSNVLFISRYHDLLKPGGRMFIILDNSVLNSHNHKDYREYIRHNFLIKAVFQLPTHTFVNQEAGGITSILYLEKRVGQFQEQPPIFARVIHNVGHGKSGKEEKEDDFSKVLQEFHKYEVEGHLFSNGEKLIEDYENDDLFLISPANIQDRIDVYFHQPGYAKLMRDLRENEKKGIIVLKKLSNFVRVPHVGVDKIEDHTVYKYLEITNIDKERGLVELGDLEEGLRSDLPDRAKLLTQPGDLLFAKPYRSLRKVVVVPSGLNAVIASSGFYGIRPADRDEATLLWGIFRSKLVQEQFIHLSSGYTQRELNDNYLSEHLLIPLPVHPELMIERMKQNINRAEIAHHDEVEAINAISRDAENAIK